MTTYTFPAIAPNTSDLKIVSNVRAFVSPLTGYTQTASRQGTRWEMAHGFTSLEGQERAIMKAFTARMNGNVHRALIYDHSYHGARGALGGTPLVDGAAQTGETLDIKGMSNNVTGIFKAGDYFSFLNANGNYELKMILTDANSNGTGLVTVTFSPEIHHSPADEATIVTTNPAGTFMLATAEAAWSNRPAGNATNPIHSDFSIDWVEDIA